MKLVMHCVYGMPAYVTEWANECARVCMFPHYEYHLLISLDPIEKSIANQYIYSTIQNTHELIFLSFDI